MFNIGTGEIALILIAALLVLGPKRLPELARGIGKFLSEFRRQTDQVRHVVEREFYRMDQEIAKVASFEANDPSALPPAGQPVPYGTSPDGMAGLPSDTQTSAAAGTEIEDPDRTQVDPAHLSDDTRSDAHPYGDHGNTEADGHSLLPAGPAPVEHAVKRREASASAPGHPHRNPAAPDALSGRVPSDEEEHTHPDVPRAEAPDSLSSLASSDSAPSTASRAGASTTVSGMRKPRPG